MKNYKIQIVVLTLFLFNTGVVTATYYPSLETTASTKYTPLIHYPELKFIEVPKVKVFVDSQKQFQELAKFASCVPQIDFIATLSVPDWVTKFPTYVWQGDDGDEYYTEGDLEYFTKKFTNTCPSFSERVKFDYIEVKDLGYPLRSGHWSVGSNWNPSRSQVLYHLTYHPNHRGKFPKSWLNNRTLEQLLSLHDDDHEGRVATKYISTTEKKSVRVREQGKKEKVVAVKTTTSYKAQPVIQPATRKVYNIFSPRKQRRINRSSCPGGNCPTY